MLVVFRIDLWFLNKDGSFVLFFFAIYSRKVLFIFCTNKKKDTYSGYHYQSRSEYIPDQSKDKSY